MACCHNALCTLLFLLLYIVVYIWKAYWLYIPPPTVCPQISVHIWDVFGTNRNCFLVHFQKIGFYKGLCMFTAWYEHLSEIQINFSFSRNIFTRLFFFLSVFVISSAAIQFAVVLSSVFWGYRLRSNALVQCFYFILFFVKFPNCFKEVVVFPHPLCPSNRTRFRFHMLVLTFSFIFIAHLFSMVFFIVSELFPVP